MPFVGSVFQVLIASPSDVLEARHAIAETLHEWNALNSFNEKKVLLPVMWESHSAPSMEGRPQEIINNQVVKSCDLLIGSFWTRLGTPTGLENSGTVEEIKWFLREKKPVMLYYSKENVPQEKIDGEQWKKLNEFKQDIRNKGIQEEYNSVDDLKTKLFKQLTIIMRGMSVEVTVDSNVVKEAKSSVESKIDAPAKFWLEDYTEKSFVVCGDTRIYKDELKDLGGKWIKCKDGKFRWNFSKKRLGDVASFLKIPPLYKN